MFICEQTVGFAKYWSQKSQTAVWWSCVGGSKGVGRGYGGINGEEKQK